MQQNIIKSSNILAGRLDAYYYREDFLLLEKKVKTKTSLVLGDYIVDISSGSTPNTQALKYYTEDKNIGIPFLRVQNLSPEGLKLEDCKYITKMTHNTLLKRNKVSSGNLLVKITGVGRMAISSVAPEGFEGNTNQHMVVIQTKDLETSKIIATFLNLDLGEKLASRRSTGGTRPALDYTALKSIPIIFDKKIVPVMERAYKEKVAKEKEAGDILASIDAYLFDRLRIRIASLSHSKKHILKVSNIIAGRLDVRGNSANILTLRDNIVESKYKTEYIEQLVEFNKSGVWGDEVLRETPIGQRFKVIRNTNFDNKYNIDLSDIVERKMTQDNTVLLTEGDILVEKSGGSPDQPVGRVALIEKEISGYTFTNFLQLFRFNQTKIYPKFIYLYLKALYNCGYMEYIQNQTTGLHNLMLQDFLKIPVPLPAISEQQDIANKAFERIDKAKNLEETAIHVVEKAKKEVEKMLLGE